MSSQEHKRVVQALYRESLRMTRSWINRRDLWRAKALEIRAQFDENKSQDPKQAQVSEGLCAVSL
jgi:NADH dehydrogenase (ubiquinone) 1 beta subcomplex subunit 9